VNALGYCLKEPPLRAMFHIALHLHESEWFQLYYNDRH
jgi:hypothetical protein